MRVSGVRNSWLTLEKKAVLARSSSARASARSALFRIGVRIRDGRRGLTGDKLEEAAVRVSRTPGTD